MRRVRKLAQWLLEGPRGLLGPLIVVYCASFLFLQQTTLHPAGGLILVLKLAVGTLLLGGFCVFLVDKPILSLLRPKRVDWLLVFTAATLGITLLFLVTFLYYAFFSTSIFVPGFKYYKLAEMSLGYILALILLISIYVYAEELFFTYVSATYLRSVLGVGFGSIATVIFFALSHLNPTPGIIIVVVLLSSTSLLFRYSTGTLLYGYIAHATLDISAIIYHSKRIFAFSPTDAQLALSVLLVVLACCVFMLLVRKKGADIRRHLADALGTRVSGG